MELLRVISITVCLTVIWQGDNDFAHARGTKFRHRPIKDSGSLIEESKGLTNEAADKEKTVTACEGSPLTIECAEGRVIKIQRANYGRTSPTVCNEQGTVGWSTNCYSSKAVIIVSRRCNGNENCRLRPFGPLYWNRTDPTYCENVPMYLEVQYSCLLKYLLAPTTVPRVETTSEQIQTSETVSEKQSTQTSQISTEKYLVTSSEADHTTKVTRSTVLTPGPGDKMRYCPARIARGIEWPRSAPGLTTQALCPNNQEGYALWRCGNNPIMWEGNPDLSQCVSPQITVIRDKLTAGTERVEDIAVEMVNVTKKEKLEGNDMQATADLMQNLMINMEKQIEYDDKPTRTRTVHKVSEAIVKTGSNMLSEDKMKSWRDLPQEEQAKVATSLVDTVEFSAFKLANNIEEPEVVTKVDINIVLTVNVISASPPVIPDVYFSPPTIHVQINPPRGTSTTLPPLRDAFAWRNNEMRIPGSVVKDQADPDGLSRLVFITYNNMDEILTPTLHNFYENDQAQKVDSPTQRPIYRRRWNAPPQDRNHLKDDVNEIQTIVNTQILSASFSDPRESFQDHRKRSIPLVEPLTYTLEHILTEDVSLEGACVFWNYTDRMYDGHWSEGGCWREAYNKTHTTCQCNHLTNFAVLMDVMGTKISDGHKLGLKVITHVGCIISIICLALSFITFVYFKNLQCDRNTIHKNLVLCLFLGEIIFLIGIDKTANKVACGIVAGMLHYIFLAAFAWMCLEGIQLYVMLIEVFESEKSRRLYYYLSAYGIPAILVGIAAAVDYKSYGTDNYCWLRADNGFIWAFVGPVLGVITINVIMLSIAIYMMCKHAATMANMKIKEKSRMDNARSWIKGAAVLIVLLGLTWAFGLLYLNEHTIAMAYLFTILNSLQGMFIFCFHCLMNEKVQKEYKRCVRHATWLPMCFRVKYGGYRSYPGSMTPQSSTSGNKFTVQYLQKLLSGRRRKRSSTSSIPTKTSSTTQWHYHNMKSDGTIKSTKSSRSSRLSDPPPEITKLAEDDTLEKKIPNRFIDASNGQMTITINNSLIDVDGVNGDLSMIDASVIDSEAVTEFCKGGMGEGAPPEVENLVKNSESLPENHYEEVAEAPDDVCIVNEKEALVNRNSACMEQPMDEMAPPSNKPLNEYENLKINENNVEESDDNGEMSSSMIVDESASTPLLDAAVTPDVLVDELQATNEEIASSSLLDDLNKYKIDTSNIDTSKPKDSEQTETDNVCHSDSDSVVSDIDIDLQSNGSTISIHTPNSISRSSLAATTPGGELDEVDDDGNAAERFEQALMSEDDVMLTSQQSDNETAVSVNVNNASNIC